MNLPQLIVLIEKLLNHRKPFGITLNSKGDGTVKLGEIKGEEIIKTLTDKKE